MKNLCVAVWCVLAMQFSVAAKVIDAEQRLSGRGLAKASVEQRSRAVEKLVRELEPGDVLALPRSAELGELDFSGIADNVQVEFGKARTIYLGGGTKNGLVFMDVDATITAQDPRGLAKAGKGQAGTLKDFTMMGGFAGNASYVDATLTDVSGVRAIDQKFENTRVYYVRYMNGGGKPINLTNTGDCKGSRIYHTVEHNYCADGISVYFENVTNCFAGVGDTEGSTSKAGCWVLKNCTNMVVFAHRMFHSHDKRCGTDCGISYIVDGGNQSKFYYVQCIGNPCSTFPSSLVVRNITGFQLWGGSYEDQCTMTDDAFLLFYSPEVMTSEFNKWTEPPQVDKEIIVRNGDYQIDGTTVDAANPPAERVFPVPPSIPSMDIGALPKHRLPKSSAAWGKALLQAGADPTGRRSSSAAFEKVIALHKTVEIPKGTFLLERPLAIRPEHAVEQIIGCGPEHSVLKAGGDFAIIECAGSGLSKGPAPLRKALVFLGKKFVGGTYGINATRYGVLTPAGKVINCTFENQQIAGIRGANGVEFDQVRVFDSRFTGGQYGILLENCMVDKQGYFKCIFENQLKAGVDASNSHMFAGSIVQCRFENIDGPGVNMGWCHGPGGATGYTPHQSMINQCEFVNCGNSEKPSIEWSWNESSALIDVTVRITNKEVLHGIAGTGQIMDRCSVFVEETGKLAGAPFGVRHTRMARNARPTGNVLRDCFSNTGNIRFLADVPEDVELKPSAPGSSNFTGLKWWQDEEPTTLYPWAYPHLIYNCKFGDNPAIGYVLLRTDRQGSILQQIPLVPGEEGVSVHGPTVRHVPPVEATSWSIHDMRGRLLARGRGEMPLTFSTNHRVSRGIYIGRSGAGKRIQPRLSR